jgi:bifunctional non-homologous end joining protein LigD
MRPAQPALVARPPAGRDWIHEVKFDGYRLIAHKNADRVTLWTRYGTNFTDRLPRIAKAVRSLPVGSALIDGEAVVFRPDGHSDFAALRTTAGAERAAFVAFDLLNVEGKDFRKLPLEVRRAELEALIEPDGAIMFSEALEDDGALVFAKACELGLEGIVSKRLGGVYLSGRCQNWLKVKNPAFLRG